MFHGEALHPNLPGSPGPADIKFYRLEKQDMSWERKIKADKEWTQIRMTRLGN